MYIHSHYKTLYIYAYYIYIIYIHTYIHVCTHACCVLCKHHALPNFTSPCIHVLHADW